MILSHGCIPPYICCLFVHYLFYQRGNNVALFISLFTQFTDLTSHLLKLA
ncbi:hypothetical protein GGQ77_003538 [Geobacillus thermodenitrificans]|nr:hypothetical protein [Geobacillus thermodenitrificans]